MSTTVATAQRGIRPGTRSVAGEVPNRPLRVLGYAKISLDFCSLPSTLKPMAVPASKAPKLLRSLVGVVVDGTTYRRLLYLALTFPLGLFYFVVLILMYSLGAGLVVVLVGVPILLVAIGTTIGLVAFERVLTSALLGVEYEDPTIPDHDSVDEFVRGVAFRRRTVLGFGYLLGQFFVGLVSFLLLFDTVFLAGSFLLSPLYYHGSNVGIHLPGTIHLVPGVSVAWGGRELELVVPITIGSWIADSPLDAIGLSFVGFCLLVATLHVTNFVGWLLGGYARRMLR
jgi:hypothetical protein